VDRCALFVDAGYLLADGAMAVHGTRRREAVSWDCSGLLDLLTNLARERTNLPVLRSYWYESSVDGARSTEHEALADIPGLKLRMGRVRPGHRDGVDLLMYRDLTTLARERAISDAVLVSGDEDMVQAVNDAQDLGLRVTGVHVAVDGNWTISRSLRQECDALVEIAAGQLHSYVSLLQGGDTTSPPLSNGQLSPPSHIPSPAGTRSNLPGQHHLAAPSPPPPPPPPAPAPPRESPNPPPPSGSVSHLDPGHPSGPTPVARPEDMGYAIPTSPPDHGPNRSTFSDAVKAAHQEGREFGDSVARDAPQLWLEAVLARKPRMPSDLEARLLQGSTLPIDYLLNDDVRNALRRGFWDALEQSRH
jgi:hypothetical protein